MKTKYLFVTCCLEESRFEVLKQVVGNLLEQAPPEVLANLTVFDNRSTVVETLDLIYESFPTSQFVVAERNVGYWSAIHWWLENSPQADYTYIIESDMIHYRMKEGLAASEAFLDERRDVGSVRLHEYSVKDSHLYDKDNPQPGSKQTIWQRHVNRVTGDRVKHKLADKKNGIWTNNFLTQLPALNRTYSMRFVFEQLLRLGRFTELDFQRLYWQLHPQTAILDGGMWHMEPGAYGGKALTGSWSNPALLEKIGYQNSRFGSIEPPSAYAVLKA